MGRPLFSQRYSSPAVAVRVEPDDTPSAEQPVCERWTYWKPFDPDSEEFFVNEVYEAFVDQITDPQQERAAFPLADESSSSSSSEEGNMSGRVTPIGVATSDGLERDEEDAGTRLREGRGEAIVVRRVNEESEERLRRDLIAQNGPRSIVPIPITMSRNNLAHPPTTPPLPSTPPSVASPLLQISPSPGLDSTPRLYSWRDFASTRGPLANSAARRSFSHVSMSRYDVSV